MRYRALATVDVRGVRSGRADAYGRAPERVRSIGTGNPCRHCLREIAAGEPMLIHAWRPFASVQPYAETGPIFLCAADCPRHADSERLPAKFRGWDRLLLRGYSPDERIVYGTGQLIAVSDADTVIAGMLCASDVAFVHLRSASNNCYQAMATES